MSRKHFLQILAIAAGMAAWSLPTVLSGGPAGARKPSIIFVMCDDLGYGDLGCYGQQMIRTPNVDRMAAEGLLFRQHYAGSTVCAPSRCVLMTGLHTGHAYVRGNRETKPMGQLPLPPDTKTLPAIMKQAGYTTALIGKWGLGGPGTTGIPTKQGFDYFFGYLCQRHAHNYYPEFLFRNEERVPLPGNKTAPEWTDRGDGAGVAVKRGQYTHDLMAAEALAYVERNKAKPFFLYLALTIPHANNEAGEKGMEVPSQEPYADEKWGEPQRGHAAMITRMDRDIGRLLAKLKELAIDDTTLVFFTSDNGPHAEGGANPNFFKSAGPLRGYKRALYEGGIRVPMIARWPGKIKPGTTDHISAFWDILPTCAELAGAPVPTKLDGISLLATLRGDEAGQKKHPYLYWEYNPGKTQAVRWVDWKAIRFLTSGKVELYNLATDLGEKKDVAGENPQILGRIKLLMNLARRPSPHFPLIPKKRGKKS